MNSKIANLIALELAVLIAIMAWLAFSRLPSVRQPTAAEEPERATGSFATVTPILKSRHQRHDGVDYRADGQEIAAEPYTNSSDLNDGLVTDSSPSYAVVAQEPVIYYPDRLGSPLDQIVAFPQPNEIITFSNVRSFGRRLRSPARFCGTRMMVVHRRPGGGVSHGHGGGFISRGNTNAHSLSPRPGLGPR